MLEQPEDFYRPVLDWHREFGRSGLPWQQDISPYRVWVSEIMLQQTRVDTAIPFFLNFLQQFPTVATLAAATEDQVLHHWTGLGYYNRARNLRRAAQQIVEQHQSELPRTLDQLVDLPGIGRSTAGAILSISMGQRASILDGNVKRVLARFHRVSGWPGSATTQKALWLLAEHYTPPALVGVDEGSMSAPQYSQAMMDLGATLCTRSKPQCSSCPVASQCEALEYDEVSLFPQPKPKKTLPTKLVQLMLVGNAAGEVLLDKRPPVGVWPGLWSLPELAMDQVIDDYCLERFGHKPTSVVTGNAFTHIFSHYKLVIHPSWVKLSSDPSVVMEPDSSFWYNHSLPVRDVGLPAPIKKLLLKTFEENL